MAVTIDPASVSMRFDPRVAKAKPRVDIISVGTRKIAFNHLTEGINLAGAVAGKSAITDPVIKITGKFDAVLDAGDSLKDFRFGFIQIGRVFALEDMYVGRTLNEGHIKVVHRLKLSATTLLDSAGGFSPMSSRDPEIDAESKGKKDIFHTTCHLGLLPATKGDSPMSSSSAIAHNRNTGADNFLFETRTDLEFTTVLVSIDPLKKVQPLMHATWHLVWHFQFRWKGGTDPVPRAIPITAGADFSPVAKGPPTNATVAALVLSPGGPFFNEATTAAKRETVLAQRPNREDNFSRPAGVPADFFT